MIIITGQTATGKTKLARELAKNIPPPGGGELVNFDSRQIYKYLDVITGKDIPKNKIWLYDIVYPDQYFSSFDFVKLAIPIIKDIENRNKTPILVGGTYLYLKHLLYGISENNSPPNFKLRKELNNKSVNYLQKMLTRLNIEVFENLNHSDKLNPRRLIRKIEIETGKTSAGKPPRLNLSKTKQEPRRLIELIGLKYKDKDKLRQIIEKRVEERLKNGAIDEVGKLLKMGYQENDPGMKTIGCQQIIKYLNKKIAKKEAIEDWINKEVQYAKRQLTFMKQDKNIQWQEI